MTNEEARLIIGQYDMNFYLDDGTRISAEELAEAFELANEALEDIDMLRIQRCEDCISRQMAIRIAEQGQMQGYIWQFEKLCTLPSVAPARARGEWIPKTEYSAECSACGKLRFTKGIDLTGNANIHKALYSFCPNCGADMRGGEE